MNRIYILLLLTTFMSSIYAQTSLETLLDSINNNNLYIKASSVNRDADIVLSSTGSYPRDPQVEYGYFPGNSSEIGTKSTFSVSQSVDFPTVYTRQKAISRKSATRADFMHLAQTKKILQEATGQYIELVYLNNLINELKKRSSDADQVKILTEKSLLVGSGNQFETNKAFIEALRMNNELNISIARMKEKEQILVSMNNGKRIGLMNPFYPSWQLLALDSLINQSLQNDPELNTLLVEQQISEDNIKLQRSHWLPQFTIGYGEEVILDEAFRGVQGGVSIPLWQNKNMVKHARLEQLSIDSRISAYRQKLESSISGRYQLVKALKDNYEEYRKAVSSVNTKELLIKALNTGHISVIEYYREITAWYELHDQFLRAEKDYYMELCILLQFIR
jgi:outer membrane protein, heavy metal efflux system